MNKLLELTLITAIMATSGFSIESQSKHSFAATGQAGGDPIMRQAGGDGNPGLQPTPTMSYDAYTAYLAKQKTCLDSCCTNCAKDLLGITLDTPARSCCMETTLGIVGVAAGVAAPASTLLEWLCANPGIIPAWIPDLVVPVVSTALALRSLVPSVKSCCDCGIVVHPHNQYEYMPALRTCCLCESPARPFQGYFVPMAPECDMGQGVDKGKNCECNDTEES